jgi:hypothetical protein
VRSGVAYIIESFIAVLLLFVFAIGAQSTSQPQDWSSYALQVETQDLTEVTEETGGLDILERGETGTLRTFAEQVSGGDLAVSGSVDIPVSSFSVAFPVLPDQRQVDQLENNLQRCSGRLGEIKNESGNILRPDQDRFEARLYIADTDPRSSVGGNNELDYDTLYVDNGTQCQFTPSEGPFYIDDYFNYTNSSAGKSFQFKDVLDDTSSNQKLVYHNASQVLRFRNLTETRLNGVKTSVSFDVINFSDASLSDYQLLVFRRNRSLTKLIGDDPSDNSRTRIDAFTDRGGSLLLMMDLEESDLGSGFLSSTDLDWVDMSNQSLGSLDLSFTDSSASQRTNDFLLGLNGDPDAVTLDPQGTVSSDAAQGILEEPLLTYQDAYESNDWNVSTSSMIPVDPDNVDGEPESECYSAGSSSDSLTQGTLSLPNSAGTTNSEDVISAELGSDSGFCNSNDVRALMIDYDGDGQYESDEGEGPFVEGDTIVRAGREYRPVLPDASTVQLVYTGSTNLEAVNYLGSHDEGELARMAYQEPYSPPNRRLAVALMYKLLPENSAFGTSESAASLSVLSSTNQSFYMPYTADLRWGER